MPLPTADALLRAHFLPLYPADVLEDLALARVTDVNPAGNPHLLAHLHDAADLFMRGAYTLFDGIDLGSTTRTPASTG